MSSQVVKLLASEFVLEREVEVFFLVAEFSAASPNSCKNSRTSFSAQSGFREALLRLPYCTHLLTDTDTFFLLFLKKENFIEFSFRFFFLLVVCDDDDSHTAKNPTPPCIFWDGTLLFALHGNFFSPKLRQIEVTSPCPEIPDRRRTKFRPRRRK